MISLFRAARASACAASHAVVPAYLPGRPVSEARRHAALPVLALSALQLQTFLLLLVSAVCPKYEEQHQQMCISSGDLRALRCSRCSASAHLHLLLDLGQQRRRVLQPAGRLLVVGLGPGATRWRSRRPPGRLRSGTSARRERARVPGPCLAPRRAYRAPCRPGARPQRGTAPPRA